MNSIQAKKIRIIDFLNSIKVYPDKISNSGIRAIYKSPLRNETKASFHVNISQNIWYDHGAGVGGNIVDLVMEIYKTDVSGVLNILDSKNLNLFSFNQQNNKTPVSRIEILSVCKIKSPELIKYLYKRKISFKIANVYLNEVVYQVTGTNNDKTYYALGFKNEKGGFELRNKYYKGSISPKYYTFIPGNSDYQVNIFEGFFDFISALELNYTQKLKYDSIILNSIANKSKVINLIKKYQNLNLFLDNDTSGKESLKFFKSIHPNSKDYSATLYPGFKDVNEYLIKSGIKITTP
ncbi:MAG: toprim domain-containing protein [Bacteroidetes bacterium]|nr:toprim domain-containing protein [Bacteroidota bacterium]